MKNRKTYSKEFKLDAIALNLKMTLIINTT